MWPTGELYQEGECLVKVKLAFAPRRLTSGSGGPLCTRQLARQDVRELPVGKGRRRDVQQPHAACQPRLQPPERVPVATVLGLCQLPSCLCNGQRAPSRSPERRRVESRVRACARRVAAVYARCHTRAVPGPRASERGERQRLGGAAGAAQHTE